MNDMRLALPLLDQPVGLSLTRATQLIVGPCDVEHARALIKEWHSRLPVTQPGPWQFAFHAHFDAVTYAVALWNNPSARMLPSHWLELRRMAVAPDAPHCTASRFLGEMKRYFRVNHPERERLLSYQDIEVHSGTIYRAAGWVATSTSAYRVRDRSKPRPSGRMYRWNVNGAASDGAGKVRWETSLTPSPKIIRKKSLTPIR
jgi:hypothetical protein